MGSGLEYLLTERVTDTQLIVSGVFSFIIFFAGTFRSSFKSGVMNFISRVKAWVSTLYYKALGFSPGLLIRNLREFFSRGVLSMKLWLSKILKGEKKELRGQLEVSKNLENDRVIPLEDHYSFQEEIGDESRDCDKSDAALSMNDTDEDLSTKKKDLGKKFNRNPSKQSLLNEKNYYSLVSSMSQKRKRDKNANKEPASRYFEDIINRIEEKLKEFKIDGEIVRVLKGPVVDTFELELGVGVKVSKVTRSEDDLSMALYGAPIRIVYPMIGKTTVGIEVPRQPRDVIFLDEVLSSDDFKRSNASLPVAMGKDAFGEIYIVDLAAMPHMLIAGATGAGKSVFINTLLVSLLVKKSPRQMHLILIDPKQLELALYANLPHLIVPVITDSKTAAISLMWAVQEMERRYSILKDFGVRNIDNFNEKIKRATPELFSKIHQYYENADQDGYELPNIVIIIDEFADLILTKAGKEIENNVCRLAAKARAAGIHLVVATQRPSVDVITGLIKSNFPTRVSFRVTSSIDSRTILNTVGAEKLLGKGDMLYKHGTISCRLHSAFVDEEEVELFTDSLMEIKPAFNSQAMDYIENEGEQNNDDPYAFGSHIQPVTSGQPKKDEKYEEALKLVIEHRSASASMLQRRLGVGYNRASNLIDDLEENGVIGPAQGSKPRKVLTAQDVY